ncbi:hypothetical protein LCGC14_1604470, partial [marine sediment metagenome]
WVLSGVCAATVVYFITDIREYKRVTIGQAIGIGLALVGGWISASLVTAGLFLLLVDWLDDNSDNVLFHFKEKSKEKPLIDGEFFQVKDGELVNVEQRQHND